jgi:hypothetical protein
MRGRCPVIAPVPGTALGDALTAPWRFPGEAPRPAPSGAVRWAGLPARGSLSGIRRRRGSSHHGRKEDGEASTAEADIVEVLRTAGGRGCGRLAGWHPADVAGEVLSALVERNGTDLGAVEDAAMDCVSQAGEVAWPTSRSSRRSDGGAGDRVDHLHRACPVGVGGGDDMKHDAAAALRLRHRHHVLRHQARATFAAKRRDMPLPRWRSAFGTTLYAAMKRCNCLPIWRSSSVSTSG